MRKLICSFLAGLLRFVANLLSPMGNTDPLVTAGSLIPKLPSDPLTAGLAVGAAALNFITTLQQEANSPDEVKAATARKKLAAMDALALAQQNNDLQAERLAAENA